MNIAICPGHHRKAKGAVNHKFQLTEYDEASKLLPYLANRLRASGHTVEVVTGVLPEKIKKINAGNFDLAIDLHFNAGGGRGCEVLYCPGNPVRRRQAARMSSTIANALGVTDRGAKAGWHRMDAPGVVDYPGDVDGDEHRDAFLSQTNCPAFIPEPIFIDNNDEVERFLLNSNHRVVALALQQAIDSFEKEI